MNDHHRELALKCYDEGITPDQYKRFHSNQQRQDAIFHLNEKQKRRGSVVGIAVFSVFLLLASSLLVLGFLETWFGYTPDWVCYDFGPTFDVNGTEPRSEDGECHFSNGLFLVTGGLAVPIGIVLGTSALVVKFIQKIVERRK